MSQFRRLDILFFPKFIFVVIDPQTSQQFRGRLNTAGDKLFDEKTCRAAVFRTAGLKRRNPAETVQPRIQTFRPPFRSVRSGRTVVQDQRQSAFQPVFRHARQRVGVVCLNRN